MKTLQRQIYRFLIRLHPAFFRSEFACEMALDFEDALESHGLAILYADAILSVARQWAVCCLPGALERRASPRPSLLGGHRLLILDGGLTLSDLLRGLILSVVLFTSLGIVYQKQLTMSGGNPVPCRTVSSHAVKLGGQCGPFK